MKTLRFLMAFILILSLGSVILSCSPLDNDSIPEDSRDQFSFSYSLLERVNGTDRGLELFLTATNEGSSFKYTGTPHNQFSFAELISTDQDGLTYSSGPQAYQPDATEYIWANGQSECRTWSFGSEDQIPEGNYNLDFWLMGNHYSVPIEVRYPMNPTGYYSFQYEIKRLDVNGEEWLNVFLTATNNTEPIEYRGSIQDFFGKAVIKTYIPYKEYCSSIETSASSDDQTYIWETGEQQYVEWVFKLSEPLQRGNYTILFYLDGVAFSSPIKILDSFDRIIDDDIGKIHFYLDERQFDNINDFDTMRRAFSHLKDLHEDTIPDGQKINIDIRFNIDFKDSADYYLYEIQREEIENNGNKLDFDLIFNLASKEYHDKEYKRILQKISVLKADEMIEETDGVVLLCDLDEIDIEKLFSISMSYDIASVSFCFPIPFVAIPV